MQFDGLAYLEDRSAYFSHKPLYGQIELTYRCDYNCLHCYCKGSENLANELTTKEVKDILDQIHKAGCLWLTFTGGDPLVRPDFKEIYGYAKQKGFIITVLTNGYRLTREWVDYFTKYAPLSVDITLNSLDKRGYEKITGCPGALAKVLKNIEYASSKGLAMIIKANCLKENKDQIGKLKRWAHNLPGKSKENLFNFRYDSVIFPRLNGDKSPCRHRLSLKDLDMVRKLDDDIEEDYTAYLKKDFSGLPPQDRSLYFCNTYKTHFFIDPYGRLKFCSQTDKFSTDLRQGSFKQGFYKEFSKLAQAKFKTDSPCRVCRLRGVCYACPASAFLETGDEEKPVKYFCRLAHSTLRKAEYHKCRKDEKR